MSNGKPLSRKQCIEAMSSLPECAFVVNANPDTVGDEPIHELSAFSEVDRNSANIDKVAKESGVDADLIRAIMYVETTHGYYDAPLAWIDKNKSILPMNINTDYWGSTFGKREDLKKPYENIRAGAEMLARIKAFLPHDASIAQIATLYNNINANRINEYGTRVEKVYAKKPWSTPKATTTSTTATSTTSTSTAGPG